MFHKNEDSSLGFISDLKIKEPASSWFQWELGIAFAGKVGTEISWISCESVTAWLLRIQVTGEVVSWPLQLLRHTVKFTLSLTWDGLSCQQWDLFS